MGASEPLVTRAYSAFAIKSFDGGTFEGIATTPATDRMHDVVEPKGAMFELPMPLLWQHRADEPIGLIESASVSTDGITVRGRVMKDLTPRIAEAWALIKAGLVRGLSIGFSPKEFAPIKGTNGLRFTKWSWHELSAVTIPANAEASITTIKSLDEQQRAASGAASSLSAGASATKPITKGKSMKTIQEQVSHFESKRAANMARMDAIMATSGEEGRTLDEPERQEYDGLQTEVKSVEDHLVRLRDHAERVKTTATPVNAESGEGTTKSQGDIKHGGSVSWGKSSLPPGTAFTRYAIALMRGKGNLMQAHEIAKQWKDSTPEVEIFLKAAVAAGTTTDATWAGPLVYAQNMVSEFVEFLRPMTVLGRIQGLRRVPFNISVPRQTAGASAGWVGQGLPKPVSKLDFDRITLARTKIAVIVAFTDELARDSSPSAEGIIRTDLAAAIAKYLDGQFLNPDVSASGTTSPASITNGLTAIAMSGTTIAAVDTDVRGLMNQFITANAQMTSPVWIMHPRTALYLSELRTANDVYVYPTINMMGGTFKGIPVITSQNVPIDTGADTWIILVDANEVLLAQEGVQLDTSTEASIQMSDSPSSGAQSLVSLWQNNMVGVRAEQYVNYKRRQDSGAVGIIENVSY